MCDPGDERQPDAVQVVPDLHPVPVREVPALQHLPTRADPVRPCAQTHQRRQQDRTDGPSGYTGIGVFHNYVLLSSFLDC